MQWSSTAVGELVALVSGGTPPRDDPRYWGGQIPWITCKDMKADRLGDSSERLTEAGLEVGSRLVPTGAILIVIRGMILARDVPVALATRPVSFNQDLKALLPSPSIDGEFLLYALKSKVRDLQRMTARAAHGTKSLLTSDIAGLAIPTPPLDEQRQIAAVLSAVQRATDRQERLIAVVAELKKALMHKFVTEGTRAEPQKKTAIGPIPKSWKVVPLGSLFSRQPTNGLYRPQSDYGQGTLILRIDDFSNEGDIVTSASNRVDVGKADCERFGLTKDDIVLNRVNSLSHLGKAALIGDIEEPMVFESNMMRFRVDEERLRSAFAFRVLNCTVCKSQIIAMAKRAVAQSSVNQGDVGRLLIPLPPDVKIQDEILAIFSALEAKSAVHARTREALADLFRTLLHQLMTGKIRVNNLDLSALEKSEPEPVAA